MQTKFWTAVNYVIFKRWKCIRMHQNAHSELHTKFVIRIIINHCTVVAFREAYYYSGGMGSTTYGPMHSYRGPALLQQQLNN